MDLHQIDRREHQQRGQHIRIVCTCGWVTSWFTAPEFATQQFEHHQKERRQMSTGEEISGLIEFIESGTPVPVAVYGTLRGGGWANHDPGIASIARDVKIHGRIYDHGYPVAKLDEDGDIVADILYVEYGSPAWDSIWNVETGAGYELRPTVAYFEGGAYTPVYAWHYMRKPRGTWIESGDYRSHQRSHQQYPAEVD